MQGAGRREPRSVGTVRPTADAAERAVEDAPIVNPVFGDSSVAALESRGRFEGGK
jgi:hypothetical protein